MSTLSNSSSDAVVQQIFATSMWNTGITGYTDDQMAHIGSGALISLVCSMGAVFRTLWYFRHKLTIQVNALAFVYILVNMLALLSLFTMSITPAALACMWGPHIMVELAMLGLLLHPTTTTYRNLSVLYIVFGTVILFIPNGMSWAALFKTYGSYADLFLAGAIIYTYTQIDIDADTFSEIELTNVDTEDASNRQPVSNISDVLYAWRVWIVVALLHFSMSSISTFEFDYRVFYGYMIHLGLINTLMCIFIEYNTYTPPVQCSTKRLYMIFTLHAIVVTITMAIYVHSQD